MLWFFLLRHAIDFDIIIFIESVSQERQVLPPLVEINTTESNGKFVDRIPIFSIFLYYMLSDILVNHPSLHAKRSFDEEINVSSE